MLPIDAALTAPRLRLLFSLLGAFALSACGGCGGGGTSSAGAGGTSGTASVSSGTASGTGGATSASSGSGSTSSGSTGGGDAGPSVDRGPTSIPVDGDPNGLFWDAATATLYIADDNNNRVLQWTDGAGIAMLAALPAAPQGGPGLGQLVKTQDGKIVVTRFGYGTAGDVVYIAPDLTTGTVPNLDPVRRRIGLTVASDGSLFDTYFIKGTPSVGAVARLDLDGTETDLLTGFQKPVGVLAVGPTLFVSDQSAGTFSEAPIAMPSKLAVLAMVDSPDLLCEGPGGSFFTGGTTGDVRQITSDGKLSTFAGGFLSVRGVAYDAAHKRLFASEHDPNGSMNALHILPVN